MNNYCFSTVCVFVFDEITVSLKQSFCVCTQVFLLIIVMKNNAAIITENDKIIQQKFINLG